VKFVGIEIGVLLVLGGVTGFLTVVNDVGLSALFGELGRRRKLAINLTSELFVLLVLGGLRSFLHSGFGVALEVVGVAVAALFFWSVQMLCRYVHRQAQQVQSEGSAQTAKTPGNQPIETLLPNPEISPVPVEGGATVLPSGEAGLSGEAGI
jgi:hypothetical protein